MKRLDNKFLFLILIFMSFSLQGGKPTTVGAQSIVDIDNVAIIPENTQDSLYQERIKNINRLEQMKYVVHQMAK